MPLFADLDPVSFGTAVAAALGGFGAAYAVIKDRRQKDREADAALTGRRRTDAIKEWQDYVGELKTQHAADVASLRAEIGSLRAEVRDLQAHNLDCQKMTARLEAQNQGQAEEIAELRQQLFPNGPPGSGLHRLPPDQTKGP